MTGKGRPVIEGQRITYIEPNADALDAWAEAEGIKRAELLRRITADALKRHKKGGKK